MKIAVPTKGNQVDHHFGHCEMYTIFTFNAEKKIISKETLPSPQGCGCKSNIAAVLKDKGVQIMLAGNMGEGAVNVLSRHGIEVFRGCTGNIDELAASFAAGYIRDSGVSCHHHEADHQGHSCNHHQ